MSDSEKKGFQLALSQKIGALILMLIPALVFSVCLATWLHNNIIGAILGIGATIVLYILILKGTFSPSKYRTE